MAKEIDYRTKHQIEVQERQRKVCEAYKELRSDNGSLAPHRLMSIVAKKFGYTVSNVRVILVQNDLYQPRAMAK